jgi:hypothetical protein
MPKVPVYPPVRKIEIKLYWKDQVTEGSNDFNNIQEFVAFLNDNPELAKKIGYNSKKKNS